MHIATGLIIMFACYMPVRAFNYTNIVGTLRSGGDSLYAAIFDVGPMYLFSIPAVSYTHLDVYKRQLNYSA